MSIRIDTKNVFWTSKPTNGAYYAAVILLSYKSKQELLVYTIYEMAYCIPCKYKHICLKI